ncbi:MAG: enoyl-CoA hydratase-related protein [Maricaulaceae bacterium]|jgi:enoyl-CoA hydratase/carnithine racemase
MSLVLTENADGVFSITLNRPDVMNAFTPELLDALKDAFVEAAQSASVVVVSGAGRAFTAGVDLKILQTINPEAGRLPGAFNGRDQATIAALRAVPCPVIAKVHGACFTGGLELALHCDFIFTTKTTKFGDTHAKFGIRPTWGMSQNLPAAVGLRRAKELSYTARTFTGEEAERWGMVNGAFDSEVELAMVVAEHAATIAANSKATVAAYKSLHRLAETEHFAQALSTEFETEFPDIQDTAERLAQFKK